MNKKTNRKGFSLIEMLVVIAIIAVLVTIIVPTVGRATLKSKAATNAANLRAVEGKIGTLRVMNAKAFENLDYNDMKNDAANENNGWGSVDNLIGVLGSQMYTTTASEEGVLTISSELIVNDVPAAVGMTITDSTGKERIIEDNTPMSVYISKTGVVATYNGVTKDQFADIAEDGVFDGELGKTADEELKDAVDDFIGEVEEELCEMGLHAWESNGADSKEAHKHTCTRCGAEGGFTGNGSTCSTCGGGCVTPDTLITLADGSTKRIDELNGTEMLLVWDHISGKFTSAPVAYVIDHDKVVNNVEVITLTFSDGNFVKIVSEHVFFDADLGKYVAITSANADTFVGHSFAAMADGKMHMTKLVSVDRHMEETEIYEVITNKTLTCFTNNVLSASAFIDGLLNVFEVDTDTMAFNADAMNADIEKYGLTNYAFFAPFVSREMFDMHNGEYMAVAMGKNVLSLDDIMGLIDLYNLYVN